MRTATTTRLLAALAATTGIAALVAAVADARRPPTFNERVAITRALPAEILAYPAGCVRFVIAVSNDGRYARAAPNYLIPRPVPPGDPCVRYASNGYWLLARGRGWKVVYNGSGGPPCSLGIPRDLERCVR
jgi:hypothetical protein